jgi:type IV pilus assembly protein PilA
MSKSKKGAAGFTLIELLLVVIVIGIVAVVAIPQFTESAKDARESTLRADLAAIRNAVELYYHQHDEHYPGDIDHTDGAGAPTDRWVSFHAQMTQYSDEDGKVSASLDRDNYPYGPYLKHGIPPNPVPDADATGVVTDSVKVTTDLAALASEDAAAKTGWIFSCKTGQIIANSDDVSQDDVTKYDEY